jgi:hypothetical protein
MTKNDHELTASEKFKAWLECRQEALKLGMQTDPRVVHLLHRCLAQNPDSASEAIAKCKGALTLAEMRMTLDNEFPRWEFVPPQNAIVLGTEVLSHKPLTVHKNVLTQGIVLITGSSSETMMHFCAHLINQLKDQNV